MMQDFMKELAENDEGTGILSIDDILAVVGILVELRNGRGEIDDIDHLVIEEYDRLVSLLKINSEQDLLR